MMILLARILAGLAATFGIVVGLGFLFDPVGFGTNFFLAPIGVPGRAVLRADMTAFFLTGGILAAVAAWRQSRSLLTAPIMLYGVAITGRAISLIVDGYTPGALVPMTVEAAIILCLCFARKTFGGKQVND